jgi:hypothetical protein
VACPWLVFLLVLSCGAGLEQDPQQRQGGFRSELRQLRRQCHPGLPGLF